MRLTARVFTITATSEFGNGSSYTFDCLQFPGGLCLVPNSQRPDDFYPSLDDVQPHGNAVIDSIEPTELTRDYYPLELLRSIAQSVKKYGTEQFQGDWGCFGRLGLNETDTAKLEEIISHDRAARAFLAD